MFMLECDEISPFYGGYMEKLAEFVEYYRRTLASARMCGRFEALMERISSPAALKGLSSGEARGIELVHEPYFEPFDEPVRWAASTEEPLAQPLRFSSRDGAYFMREFPGGEAGESRYLLIADEAGKAGGVEIEIDGVALRTDAKGALPGLPPDLDLSKDSRIILRPGAAE